MPLYENKPKRKKTPCNPFGYDEDILPLTGKPVEYDATGRMKRPEVEEKRTIPIPGKKPYDSPNRPTILEGISNDRVISEMIFEEGNPEENNFMFKDTARNGGKITVAGGILLDTVEDAKKLSFTIPDSNGGRRFATDMEIERGYRKVEAVQEGNIPAYRFNPKKSSFAKDRGLDDLELTPNIAKRNFDESIRSSVSELRRKFPGFDNFHNGPQRALLDMEFNMGRNFNDVKWKKLFRAVHKQDWATAASESSRKTEGSHGMIGRNRRTKDKFLEAIIEKD